MFGCALVVTVPAVPDVPDETAYVALATVPVTLAPVSAVKLEPLPANTPVLAVILTAVTVPFTPSPVNVPVEVIFGCAFVVTVPAVLAVPEPPALTAYVALATVPVTLAPGIAVSPVPAP